MNDKRFFIIYACDNPTDRRVIIDYVAADMVDWGSVQNYYRDMYSSEQVCVITDYEWKKSGFINDSVTDIREFLRWAT